MEEKIELLKKFWQIRQYPLKPDFRVIPEYNDRPVKCPYCKEGMVYPTYAFNLGWCAGCHYFWGWGYVNSYQYIL